MVEVKNKNKKKNPALIRYFSNVIIAEQGLALS